MLIVRATWKFRFQIVLSRLSRHPISDNGVIRSCKVLYRTPVKPNVENNRAVIPSGSLLRYIGKTVRYAEGEVGELTEQDLGSWYIGNPISMEQIIEILIAVVEGVSFRLQAEEEAATQVRRDSSIGDRIMRLERKLRGLVRAKYLATYQMSRPEDRIKEMLGPREYEQCTHRMEKARANVDVNVDFLDFLYVRHLQQLIVAEYLFTAATSIMHGRGAAGGTATSLCPALRKRFADGGRFRIAGLCMGGGSWFSEPVRLNPRPAQCPGSGSVASAITTRFGERGLCPAANRCGAR